MEALYLLGSVVFTIATSSLLSLFLALRFLLSRALSSPSANAGGSEPSTDGGGGGGDAPAVRLYKGRVRHARRHPVTHTFEYPVRYALIDLDRAPPQFRLSHLSADRARGVAATNGPVFLLTIPASVGYEQNPLSVYYCYNVAGEEEEQDGGESSPLLKVCIAEVTNTPWGERALFVFNPGSDLVAKPLHVSPFMDMLGNWSMHADAPGKDLSIAISVEHPTLGNFFTATLHAKQVYSSSSSLKLATFFWLMPHKVAIWIYWQALKLWWKNVRFLQHPKYINPMYRDDALIRDRKLCCSRCIGKSKNQSIHARDEDHKYRWFAWKDAQWPWS